MQQNQIPAMVARALGASFVTGSAAAFSAHRKHESLAVIAVVVVAFAALASAQTPECGAVFFGGLSLFLFTCGRMRVARGEGKVD